MQCPKKILKYTTGFSKIITGTDKKVLCALMSSMFYLNILDWLM